MSTALTWICVRWDLILCKIALVILSLMSKQLLVLLLGALLSEGGRFLKWRSKDVCTFIHVTDLTPFCEYTQISFGIFWGNLPWPDHFRKCCIFEQWMSLFCRWIFSQILIRKNCPYSVFYNLEREVLMDSFCKDVFISFQRCFLRLFSKVFQHLRKYVGQKF